MVDTKIHVRRVGALGVWMVQWVGEDGIRFRRFTHHEDALEFAVTLRDMFAAELGHAEACS